MQAGARYRLVVRRGPQPNQQYELTRDTVTVGRDITNDIVISDPEVSRHHARLIRGTGGYVIEDLRSTNGTFINRERISSPYQLRDGDLIGMGETVTLSYEVAGATVDAPPPMGSRQAPDPGVPAYRPPTPPPPQPSYREPAYDPRPVEPAPLPDYYDDEEPEADRNRWLVIGCAVLTLVFCCALVGAAIAIDSLNLYCDVPVIQNMSFFCAP